MVNAPSELQNIYEEMYESKVRSQDLLKNLTLDNYHDVKFQRENDYFIATVNYFYYKSETVRNHYPSQTQSKS